MGWRDPTPFEIALLEDARERWADFHPLALHLFLAPRVEQLLLRNTRLHYVPQVSAECESLLWFSPLIAARSSREIVFHLGVAKALAEEFLQQDKAQEKLDDLWQFTCRHTRHWRAEDRMERDLRYHALRGDSSALQDNLRGLLRQLHRDASDTERIELARLAKRVLPVIAPHGAQDDETRWLAQYAAMALGDAGAWANPGEPRLPPDWMVARLPPVLPQSRLAVEIRHDATEGQVLHFIPAQEGEVALTFSHPLPARLYIAPEGKTGTWHGVGEGVRIRINPPSPHLRLSTLEGLQWDLHTQGLPGLTSRDDLKLTALHLAHVTADRELAEILARWLRDQGIAVELVPDETRPETVEDQADQVRVLRLWTQAASRYWAGQAEPVAARGGILLCAEAVSLPQGGAPGGLLDWRDWKRLMHSPEAARLLEPLKHWLEEGELPTPPETWEHEPYSEEIESLLQELANPETEPPRRLEIGDRLAELGDPRPGVGVVEIEQVFEATENLPASLNNEPFPDMQDLEKPKRVRQSLFELEELDTQDAKIKVIGVGGCGGNAVAHMIVKGMTGVEFITIDTDAQALQRTRVPVQLQIGNSATKGRGAGGRWEVGREAALEDHDRIVELIEGTDMLFIVAGMGGGTGTGAAPVVAEVAKDLGILAVAVVTKPFVFEGKRMRSAETGLKSVSEQVDSLIVIPNEKLIAVMDPNSKLTDAFIAANDVLHNAVSGISEIISKPGMINVDFADVKTVMSEIGMAMMGSADASGENRAREAAEAAVASPLLENVDLKGARGVLVNITSDDSLTVQEYYEVMNTIQGFAAEEATVIVGTSFDEAMGSTLRVTMVATGLGNPVRSNAAKPVMKIVEPIRAHMTGTDGPTGFGGGYDPNRDYDSPTAIRTRRNQAAVEMAQSSGIENLDIPTFLRKQTNRQKPEAEASSMFEDDAPSSEAHTFGGLWTLRKLQALEKYLKAFNIALSRQNFMRVYIDAFAGTGWITIKEGEGNSVIEGSARRALKVEPTFDHYCFIELQARKVAALRALSGEFPDKSVAVIPEDANVALRELCRKYNWRDTRAVLFLDPYGFHVDWTTLQAIAATEAIDVWYLFPYSGLYRQMARNADAIDSDKAAAITRILGTEEWRQRLFAPPRQLDIFGDQHADERAPHLGALLDFVSERLGNLFPAVTKPKVLYQDGDSRNPKGAPLFALYFAAANPDPKAFGLATKIAQDVLNAL